jgi:hypothetical protein
MTCKSCEEIEDVTETGGPFVIRACSQCGRPIKLREPGKHGIGLQVRAGDQVVIPAEWVKLAANPLKGTGQFTKSGLDCSLTLSSGAGWRPVATISWPP